MSSSRLAFFRLVPIVGLSLAVLALNSCGNGVGPNGNGTNVIPDPSVADSVLSEVLQGFFDDNESVTSATGPLGGFITALTQQQPAPPPLALAPATSADEDIAAVVRSVRAALSGFSVIQSPNGPSMSFGIPQALETATCVWNFDPVNPGWADDTPRRGLCGAQNCIRFVLYPLDASGLPASQTEIGYIDITDLTTFDDVNGVFNISVGVRSDVGGATLLDYSVTGPLSETSLGLGLSGNISDGTDVLAIFFGINGSPVAFSTSFSVAVGGFDLGLDFTRSETGALSYTASVTVLATDDLTEFVVNVDPAGTLTQGSRIDVNGNTVATLTGTTEGFTAVPVQGSGVTNEQLLAFASLFQGVEQFFVNLAQLLAFGVANTGNTVIIG